VPRTSIQTKSSSNNSVGRYGNNRALCTTTMGDSAVNPAASNAIHG